MTAIGRTSIQGSSSRRGWRSSANQASLSMWFERNHDASSKLTRSLPLPKNVHLFPDKAPKTLTDDNLGWRSTGRALRRLQSSMTRRRLPTLSRLLQSRGVAHVADRGGPATKLRANH